MPFKDSGTIDEYRAAFPDNADLEIRLDRLEQRQFKYLSMICGFMIVTFAFAMAAFIKVY